MKTSDFINESAVAVAAEAMEKESEVQLARQDCHAIAKGAIELYHILKDLSEMTDLDNDCVANLNMAAKYIQEALEYFDAVTQPAEGAFTFESADAKLQALLDEGIDFDQIRKDASTSLKANIDKQSDARIAAKKNPPKEKGFWQSVGDKQIGMVKGAFKGAVKGLKGEPVEEEIAEDAGTTCSSSVAAVVGGLGEKTGQKSLLKRQGAMSNVLQPPKSIKVKGGY